MIELVIYSLACRSHTILIWGIPDFHNRRQIQVRLRPTLRLRQPQARAIHIKCLVSHVGRGRRVLQPPLFIDPAPQAPWQGEYQPYNQPCGLPQHIQSKLPFRRRSKTTTISLLLPLSLLLHTVTSMKVLRTRGASSTSAQCPPSTAKQQAISLSPCPSPPLRYCRLPARCYSSLKINDSEQTES